MLFSGAQYHELSNGQWVRTSARDTSKSADKEKAKLEANASAIERDTHASHRRPRLMGKRPTMAAKAAGRAGGSFLAGGTP